ncbi:hypothetical protein KAR91_63010 [Candidatus Pacearchaeota archaeon]|nr:hypothetical protein [Candidatus Pacearchaeota archaeon]
MGFASIGYNIILLDMLVSQVSFDEAVKNAFPQTAVSDVVLLHTKDVLFIMSNGLRLSWDNKLKRIDHSEHNLDEVLLRWARAAGLRASISLAILKEINDWNNKQRGN